MRTLYLERSVSTGRDGTWAAELDLADVGRIVVGTGPGSFAGIRAAIAFAQGYALGKSCEVLGLPSPCALAREGEKIAVVGDARRGLRWIALFDGWQMLGEVFQIPEDQLPVRIPADFKVLTPDEGRIGEQLKSVFGMRYLGGAKPTVEGLRKFVEHNPALLVPEPLPIYLNPAVRID